MSPQTSRHLVVRKLVRRRQNFALLGITVAIVLGSVVAAKAVAETESLNPAAPADPSKVLGNAACVKCHASEQAVWSGTPHARTFDELHRRPEAAQIAAKLNISSIKHGDRCVACHYTLQSTSESALAVTTVSLPSSSSSSANVHAIAGISCESCHGPAKDWLEAHHDYGDPNVTRVNESPEYRIARIARSVSLGMRNPHNVYLVAQSCYRCHTAGDEELVNVGGHSAGSLDFEFVSWSQGSQLHNFVRNDGKENEMSSPNRLRFMFVAGVIADTESSLRAVAKATMKDTYAVTVAKRASRAGGRLKSVAAKVDDERLNKAVEVFASVKIKLNNGTSLKAAADELSLIGFELAQAESDPNETVLQKTLEVLDPFIPDRKTWK
jgi:hypothetical protein